VLQTITFCESKSSCNTKTNEGGQTLPACYQNTTKRVVGKTMFEAAGRYHQRWQIQTVAETELAAVVVAVD